MSRLILFTIIFVIFASFVSAKFVGIYEPGETIRFSAFPLNQTNQIPKSPTLANAKLFGPYDDEPINISTFVESNFFTGFFRGNFTVGSGNQTGLWTLALNFTTISDFFPTMLTFQVLGDTHGLESAGANSVTSLSNQATLLSVIGNINVTIPRQTALEVYRINSTSLYLYNRTSFTLLNISHTYLMPHLTLNISVMENFTYDNESYLNKTQRISS